MRLIDMTCPHCGGLLKINPDNRTCVCNYCGAKLILDNETMHLQFDNAFESGYQFEKGRQRAQAEARQQFSTPPPAYSTPPQKRKKAPTWLWVIGWILIFPVPLTILMLRNKTLDCKVKYGVIAVAWIIYLCIGAFGGSDKSRNSESTANNDTIVTADESSNTDLGTTKRNEINNTQPAEQSSDAIIESDTTVTSESVELEETEWTALENCAKAMNSYLSDELVPVETFQAQDRDSGHYRTEFRLNAYNDAVGKSYSYNNASIDFIVREESWGEPHYPIRIYTTTNDFDQNLELFKAAAKAMEPDLTDQELQEAVDYLIEHRSANGYYFSNLGLVFNASEMMIKYSND